MGILSFRPTKGVAFRLYANLYADDSNPVDQDAISTFNNAGISKDGGAFVSLTNTPVFLSAGNAYQEGFFYLDLTASEMDANIICVAFRPDGDTAHPNSYHYVFYTSGTTSLSTEVSELDVSAGALDFLARIVADGYSVTKKASNLNGYNYYGAEGVANNKWYIIMRDKTDGSEVKFYMNRENRQSFETSWTNKASLSYFSKPPTIR